MLDEDIASETERLRKRLEQDAAAMDSALRRFIAHEPASDLLSGGASDSLIAACSLVAGALKLKIKQPPASERESRLRNPLENIAKASKIRMRKVILKDDWWKRNNGPLLAFIDPDMSPVALLQPAPASYVLHDPAANTKKTVDAETAAALSPFAFQFYRPFPEGPVTLATLLRFGSLNNFHDYSTVLVMGLIGGLLGLILPLCTSVVFDSVIPMAQRSQLLHIGMALLVGALASAMFDMTRAIAILRIEGDMEGCLQSAVMDRLLSMPASFFRQFTVGDLSTRAMGIETIRQLVTGTVTSSLLSGVFSVFSVFLLFFYSRSLALWAVGLVLLAVVINLSLMAINLRYQRELVNIRGKISGFVFQFINGIAKLRVSGSETRGFARWAVEFQDQKRYDFKSGVMAALIGTSNSLYPVVFSMSIFALFYFNQLSGNGPAISMGEFLSFTAAFGQFLAAGIMLSASLVSVLSVVPLYERALPILRSVPEGDETKTDPGELSGNIEIRNVTFRYSKDGPTVLNNVSLQVNPGEFIAIVGPSGSGKSTLLRLLMGFEKPETGSIYYENQDIQTLDLQAIRRQTGVVLQNAQIMAGDILHNIIGSNNLTVDDAWEAARMAGFDKDIEEMPMGMFTFIPPGGSTISGGQRQRLIIARAMVTKPRLFFFDEATSALDNITQAIVSKSLEQFKATRLVIAHRLSTVINADRIIVIDRGSVVESGTYEELMKKEGLFCELAKRQLT